MAATRITASMSGAIRTQVLQNAYAAEQEDLERRAREAAYDFYIEVHGGPERVERMMAFHAEFPEAFSMKTSFYFRSVSWTLPDALPWIASQIPLDSRVSLRTRDAMDALQNERNLLLQKRVDLADRVSASLRALRTTDRAREVFPEFADFLPLETKNLPAVQYDDLRTQLCQAHVIECEEAVA